MMYCLHVSHDHHDELSSFMFFKDHFEGLSECLLIVMLMDCLLRFFSLTLPGYSAFLFDYLAAANTIISSTELKGVPRTEAVSIAGSLLAYPSLLPSLPLLLPSPDQLTLVSSAELQDQVCPTSWQSCQTCPTLPGDSSPAQGWQEGTCWSCSLYCPVFIGHLCLQVRSSVHQLVL